MIKKHLGPQNLTDMDLSRVYQVHFQKKLEPNYHQDMLGAFTQKSLGFLIIRVKYNIFCKKGGI